jgi:hypothetical protein
MWFTNSTVVSSILTGTPAGNGLGNLHGQYLVLDKGQRLGRYKTQFETNFMTKGRYNQLKPLPSTKEAGAPWSVKYVFIVSASQPKFS